MRQVSWLACAALALTVLGASTAGAQSVSQFFNLSTPGARANGMGGAFVGVADDASAAVTNPAGLAFLTRPQVYLELKSSTNDIVGPFGDRIDALRGRLSFFSVSAPINSKIAVAFSRHEFFGADLKLVGFQEEHFRGTSYAGSVSMAVQPNLKVGVSVAAAKGTLSTDDTTLSDDSAVGATIGVLYQANEMVSVGASGSIWSGAGSSDTLVAPNQFRVGVGLTPIPLLKVAVDVVRVSYPEDFAESATDFHAGAEYQVYSAGQNRVFARAGVFSGRETSNTTFELEKKGYGSFGAGMVVGQQLQIDLAVLTRKEVVVSAAVRF